MDKILRKGYYFVMKESDLFSPIKEYFEENGYTGDGEVASIDLFLEKDGLTTAVELKKSLDFRSIQQAALDQKTCDFVYIGIFRPRDLNSRSFKDRIYLLKRLGIGLICVSARSGAVEVVSEPLVSEISNFQRYHKDKTEAIKAEFKKRKLKANTGGVNRTRLMTAYKEEALLLLETLGELGGQASCKRLRELTGIAKSTSILYDNYYGWFENVSKGVYKISAIGFEALEEYNDEIAALLTAASAHQ